MKHSFQKMAALLLSLGVLFGLAMTAYARAVPDLTRPGSITITTRKGDTVISGGTLTLYRVGEVAENGGTYCFQPTGEFTSCAESFADLADAANLAARLLAFAEAQNISGLATQTIGADGSVNFSGLELGLYLVVQHQAAPGYAKLAPFLVGLPYLEDGQYHYDLTAAPKTDLEPEPTEPPPTTEPTKPDPSLPQTGQLWWPVPVLTVAGMSLLAMGWVLCRKEKQHEG